MAKLASIRGKLAKGAIPTLARTSGYRKQESEYTEIFPVALEIEIDNHYLTHQEFWLISLLTFTGLLTDSNLILLQYLVHESGKNAIVLKTVVEIAGETGLSGKTVVESIKSFKCRGFLQRRGSAIVMESGLKIPDDIPIDSTVPIVLTWKSRRKREIDDFITS
jgi:hypothetical protein